MVRRMKWTRSAFGDDSTVILLTQYLQYTVDYYTRDERRTKKTTVRLSDKRHVGAAVVVSA